MMHFYYRYIIFIMQWIENKNTYLRSFIMFLSFQTNHLENNNHYYSLGTIGVLYRHNTYKLISTNRRSQRGLGRHEVKISHPFPSRASI